MGISLCTRPMDNEEIQTVMLGGEGGRDVLGAN